MEYNKKQFKKVGCKKVLHKINKSWVTVSVALLGMIGGGALAHADNVNASNVTHTDTNPNTERNVSDQHPSTGQSQHASLITNAGSGFQSSAVHSPEKSGQTLQISKATSALQDQIVQHVSSASNDQFQSSTGSLVNQSGSVQSQSASSSLGFIGSTTQVSAVNLNASSAAQGQIGTITLQYLLNNKVVDQTSLHRKVGADFSLTYYLVHVPKGLSIEQVLGNGDEIYSFTKQPQTIQIAVNKTAAQQIVHATLEYIDTNDHNRVVGTPIKLKGPLGERINYSKYESSAPLGFQTVGLGQSDQFLEDGDVDRILVKEVSSGPGPTPSSANSIASDSSALSADRSQFAAVWSRAQSYLKDSHLHTDSGVVNQFQSEQTALNQDSSAFQSEMSGSGSLVLDSASNTIQATSSVANGLSTLASTADSAFAASQIAAGSFQQLSSSVSSQVTAAKADVTADDQRINVVAGTVNSLTSEVRSLAAAAPNDREVAQDQATVLSMAASISAIRQSMADNSQALNTVAAQISSAVGHHDSAQVTPLASSIVSYDREAGTLVGQVNQADAQMTQAANAAVNAGHSRQPVQPVQNQDQIIISYEDLDTPQRSFAPQILNHVNAQQLAKGLVDHLLQNNAAGLINDDQNFKQLLSKVPSGYGVVGIQNAQLAKSNLMMTFQLRHGAQSSLHNIVNNLPSMQIYYQNASSGQNVSTLHLDQNSLRQLLSQGNLKNVLVPNDNYTYVKLIDAQISNGQPIMKVAVQPEKSSNDADQFRQMIQHDVATVTSVSAQVAPDVQNSAVQEDPSVAASMSSAETLIRQASSQVQMDLMGSDRIATLNARNEAQSANSEAVVAHGLLLDAYNYVNSLSDNANQALLNANTAVNDVTTVSSGAAADASSAGSEMSELASLAGHVNSAVTSQMGGLLSQANHDNEQIRQFNTLGQTTDQHARSLLDTARTDISLGHYQQAMRVMNQLVKAEQDLNNRTTDNVNNVNNLQQLVISAKNLTVSGPAKPVKPSPQNNHYNQDHSNADEIGAINVLYINDSNQVISSTTLKDPVGDAFNLANYIKNMPNGYRFSEILLGDNVQHFTKQPQDIIIKGIRTASSSNDQQPDSSAGSSAAPSAASASADPNANANRGNQNSDASQSNSSNSLNSNDSGSNPSSASQSSDSGSSAGSDNSSAAPSGSGDNSDNSDDGDSDGNNSVPSSGPSNSDNNDSDNDDSETGGNGSGNDDDSTSGSASPASSENTAGDDLTGGTGNRNDRTGNRNTTNNELPQTGNSHQIAALGMALLALSATLLSFGLTADRHRF